jgi:hypothetical protein
MARFSIHKKIQAVVRYQQGSEGLKSFAKSIGVLHFFKKTGLNNTSILVKKPLRRTIHPIPKRQDSSDL